MRTGHLVILAGGQATRLGPVTATMSKALVTVGSQPMIIRQIVGLKPTRVTVVTNPTTRVQVNALLHRVYGKTLPFTVIEQPQPLGPVDAILIGLKDVKLGEATTILMADSLYDFDEIPIGQQDDWVAVAAGEGLPNRPFCWVDSRRRRWEDSANWDKTDYIFTGLIRTKQPERWRGAAAALAPTTSHGPEVQMSALLERMPAVELIEVPWHDTGDLPALAATTRSLFIKRDHHLTALGDDGVFHKSSCGPQVQYLIDRTDERHPLFPRVFGAADDEVWLEFIDLPTLAELWLYWPGTVDVWRHIIEQLLIVVSTRLWPGPELTPMTLNSNDVDELLVSKLERRLAQIEPDQRPAPRAVADLIERLGPVIARPMPALIHGDLNMTNILYSARTDTFKLIDPRGDGVGDLRYDLAKLRYSWNGFVKTVHGVPDTPYEHQRPARELDEVISQAFPQVYLTDLAAIEASIFWSALPLHPEHQRSRLVRYGYDRLTEALR